MLNRRVFLAFSALSLVSAAPPPEPSIVRVRLITSAGNITLALDARRAPKTVANFMLYVDDGRLENTEFYRTARRTSNPKLGFVQGGIGTDARRMLPALPLEPTNRTGIKHLDGTISMAHGLNPDSANGNFSIMVGDNPSLDARPNTPGFAAFGKVIGGMDVVHRMLAMPSGGGRGVMRGQMITKPVKIVRAERLNGTAKPSGRPKSWLITMPWHKQ